MNPRPLLLAAVVLSGAAALSEEVGWSRALRRILGSTSRSTALVLAGILGGMALGSWLGGIALRRGGRADRRAALRGFGLSTLFSGVTALLFTLLLAALEGADSLPSFLAAPAVLLLAGAAVPWGVGFPFLVAALGRAPSPGEVGVAYGLNALGGAAAALLTPLVLIPTLGERESLALAAGLQLVVGGALALAAGRAAGEPDWAPAPSVPPAGVSRAVLLLVFSSGAAVIYWEVLWTRLLVLVVGSSVLAFSVAAGGVVLGIGLGSILFARAARTWSSMVPLGVLLLLAGGYFAVSHLPDAYLAAARALPGRWRHLAGAGGAGAVVILACAPLGLIFPWVVARAPGSAGRLAAANGLGAGLGALLGGHLVPGRLGIEASYVLGLIAVGLLGVAGAWADPWSGRRTRVLALLALALVPPGIAAAGSAMGGWDLKRLLSGVYQWPADYLLSRDPGAGDLRMLFIAEGSEAIVSVEDDGATVFVKANGKVEGTVPAAPGVQSLADLPTQVLLGALPAILRPGGTAGAIGLGSGTTLGAAHRAGLGSIDLLEIEPAFARAILSPACADRFAPYLGQALQSARVKAWYGDARQLLAGPLAGRRWDVLLSQPSEPWIAASAPLFTREFFGRAARRLDRAGVFVQWIQLYKLPREALVLFLRTFRASFERVFVFRPPGTGELILLGAGQPLDLAALLAGAARLERSAPGLLASAGVEAPEDLLAAFLLGPDGVDQWLLDSPGVELNTDDRGELEHLAPPGLHSGEDLASANLRAIRRRGGSDPISRYLPPALREPRFLRRLAERNLALGDAWEALAILSGDPSSEAGALRARAERETSLAGEGAPGNER